MNHLDEVVTVAEAIQRLYGATEDYKDYRAHVRQVQRMCKSGKLIARQDYKGTWLILKSSIDSQS